MIKQLAYAVLRRVTPVGSQRWYLMQSLVAVLPRTRGGPCLQSRFYEATLPACGSGLQLFGSVYLHRPEKIRIGSRVIMAQGVHITGHDWVTIGDDVAIGPYTVINSGDHRHGDPRRLISSQGHVVAPIAIADDVWISAHCVILRGVRIGSGAVAAAMSVVRDDVPENTIVAGAPAKVKRRRAPAADTAS